MIKVFALDSSTTTTGWAVFEDGDYIRSGIIDLRRTKYSAEERINKMCTEMIDLIRKEKPNIIVIEKVNVNRNLDTIRKLCRIIDVCFFYTLIVGNVRFHEYTPSEWRGVLGMQKKSVGRPMYKAIATEYVHKNFKEDAAEDEADAICIGAAYISEYINMNRYHLKKGDFNE